MTPQNNLLYESVCHESLDIFYFSIAIGGDIHFTDTFGNTLLHTACEKNNTNFVPVLIRYGIDINATNQNKDTALHIAIKKRRIEIIKILLKEKGIRLDLENKIYETPLYISIKLKYHKISFMLLKHTPMLANMRCYDGDKTYLHIAAEYKNYILCKQLLKMSVDVNALDIYEAPSIHYAIEHGELEIVDLLVQYNASLTIKDCNDYSSIHWAIESGDVNVVEYVLSHDVNIEAPISDNETPIILSIHCYEDRKCGIDIIHLLLEKKVNIHHQDDYGNTALHYAAETNNADLIELLLEYKADKYIRNDSGFPPFEIALLNQCKRRVLHLLT